MQETLLTLLGDYKFRVGLFLFLAMSGLLLVLASVILGLRSENPPSADITIEKQSAGVGDGSRAKNTGNIVVDIAGAVVKPGVYEIPYNSRMVDALIPAGGLAESADRNYLSKYINMAQKLVDGQKIYIPSLDEKNFAPVAGSVAGVSDVMSLINLNTASSSQLDTLPGIGPATAEKIMAARPYSAVEELVSKKAVSQSVFDKIKGKVSVY